MCGSAAQRISTKTPRPDHQILRIRPRRSPSTVARCSTATKATASPSCSFTASHEASRTGTNNTGCCGAKGSGSSVLTYPVTGVPHHLIHHRLTALAQGFKDFLDAMQLTEPAHLVGNSLGGAVVMQLAAQAPSQVRSLTLVNSAGFGREVTLPLRPLGQLLTRRPSLTSARRVEESLFHDPVHVTEKRINLGYRLASRPHGTRVLFETARSLGTLSGIRPAWRKELLEALTTQHIATLVVWGATDTIFPAAHLTTASQYFPHASTHCFPATGHMPQIERSQEFARLLTRFWSETQCVLACGKYRTEETSLNS